MMMKEAQKIRPREIIVSSFIEGDQLPFYSEESDVLYNLMPHQSCFAGTKNAVGEAGAVKKSDAADCVCIKKHTMLPSFDSVVTSCVKRKRGLVWINPTSVPVECLACIISLWMERVRSSDTVGLGFIIPDCETGNPSSKTLKAWVPSSSGPLSKVAGEIKIPVWYPSLRRDPDLLEKASEIFKPIEIFPIVDFPRIIGYTAEKEIATHHRMLDRYRTRTRNFIYLNNGSPEEGLKMLSGSFEAVSRDGRMPRTLLLTPGGSSISYLITLIAGVLAGATFIITESEVPFREFSKRIGFALMKKCE
jgi:hypothetical protein